ncbi:MAG: hypothetical protein IJC95_02955 [Clostridia bacterium]|nr:hypothetical protein [Oscillospiraceae bacterium]MBQ2773990.1 hypothetical protein [Clostridia bacterium]MBQ3056428.1 hypothetical protein [Clostridia bacterium]
MKNQEKETRKKVVEPSRHLLAARAKEIKVLREDIAGFKESVRLASAFMALLSLAAAGEPDAKDTVQVSKGEDTYTVEMKKSALAQALQAWQVEIGGDAENYRIVFRQGSVAV